MTRIITFATAIAFSSATLFAQSHSQGHPQGQPHAPGHASMDPALHAALHALYHGNWQGTLTAPKGVDSPIALRVGTDQTGKAVFEVTGAASLQLGAVADLALHDQKLQWRQDMSGKACKAVAGVTAAKSTTPETLSGTMSCGEEQFSFTLTKSTK